MGPRYSGTGHPINLYCLAVNNVFVSQHSSFLLSCFINRKSNKRGSGGWCHQKNGAETIWLHSPSQNYNWINYLAPKLSPVISKNSKFRLWQSIGPKTSDKLWTDTKINRFLYAWCQELCRKVPLRHMCLTGKNEIKVGSQFLYYLGFLCRKLTLALMQEVLGSILKACRGKKKKNQRTARTNSGREACNHGVKNLEILSTEILNQRGSSAAPYNQRHAPWILLAWTHRQPFHIAGIFHLGSPSIKER